MPQKHLITGHPLATAPPVVDAAFLLKFSPLTSLLPGVDWSEMCLELQVKYENIKLRHEVNILVTRMLVCVREQLLLEDAEMEPTILQCRSWCLDERRSEPRGKARQMSKAGTQMSPACVE